MRQAMLRFLVLSAGLAACSADAPSADVGALEASPEAHQLGVSGYLVSGDEVQILGTQGQSLGVVQLSTPSAASRLMKLQYASGESYESEITRPMADGRFRVPVLEHDLPSEIQLDPALAPFFAAHQLTFTERQAPPPSVLTADAVASCSVLTWPPGCFLTMCHTDYDYTDGSGIRHTQVTGYANCPAVTCAPSCYSYDQVSKYQACDDPGSCQTPHPNGQVGCDGYQCNSNQICCGYDGCRYEAICP